MADAMREKVKQAISRKRNDLLSDELLATAALDACHFDELIDVLAYCDAWMSANIPPEDVLGNTVLEKARAVLAKVEEETVDFGDEGHA